MRAHSYSSFLFMAFSYIYMIPSNYSCPYFYFSSNSQHTSFVTTSKVEISILFAKCVGYYNISKRKYVALISYSQFSEYKNNVILHSDCIRMCYFFLVFQVKFLDKILSELSKSIQYCIEVCSRCTIDTHVSSFPGTCFKFKILGLRKITKIKGIILAFMF